MVADDDVARWLSGEIERRPGASRPGPDGGVAGTSAGAASGPDGEIPLPPAPAEQTLRAVRDGDLSDGTAASGVDAPAQIPDPADAPAATSATSASSAEDDQLALGDDAIALVTGGAPASSFDGSADTSLTTPATGPATDWRDETRSPSWLDQPASATPEPMATEELELDPEPAQDVLFGEPTDPAQEQPAPRPGRRRGRAAIPSWDEIMFGGPADGAPLADAEHPDERPAEPTDAPDEGPGTPRTERD